LKPSSPPSPFDVTATDACFVDLGANEGRTTIRFLKTINSPSASCFLFEPQKRQFKNLRKTIGDKRWQKDQKWYSKFSDGFFVKIYKQAAWIKNKKLKFLIGKKRNGTNSRLQEVQKKLKFNDKKMKSSPEEVQAIDFPTWLGEHLETRSYDLVFLKMDVEGAEYEILDKMLLGELFKKIDALFIEYHGTDNKKQQRKRNKQIIEKNPNIKIYIESRERFGYTLIKLEEVEE